MVRGALGPYHYRKHDNGHEYTKENRDMQGNIKNTKGMNINLKKKSQISTKEKNKIFGHLS